MVMLNQHRESESAEPTQDSGLQERMRSVLNFWNQYERVFRETKFSNNAALKETEKWVKKTKLVDNPADMDSIVHREEFFRSEYAQMFLRDGVPIYREFVEKMAEASPYISKNSKDRWWKRFYDESIGIQAKKYWIQHQMSSYIAAWKEQAEDRQKLIAEPGFKELLALDPKYVILTDAKKEALLEKHFDERADLIAEARSIILAGNKEQLDLHWRAEKKLHDAVRRHVLSPTKVGAWLHRIFKANHSRETIKKFLTTTDLKSLTGLIRNWEIVKGRFDDLTKEAQERGEETAARGQRLMSEAEFLNLDYDRRLKYVDELDRRLTSSKNIAHEKPVFIEIRHAMDMHDWEDAAMLVTEAKMDPTLTPDERGRLESMERYAAKFSTKPEQGGSMEKVLFAKRRIDIILKEMEGTHGAIHPMVLRLMKGPMANRSIHQLRWMVYNNKWCRNHGFLDDTIARNGASKQNERLTKERGIAGEYLGRHDVMSYETADEQFIQKEEYAKTRATYRHINVKDGVTLQKNAKWLEHEQNPRELYWTTACFHEDGEPKSEIWHNELFMMLTELRGHARTIGNAEMMYDGPGNRLRKRGVQTAQATTVQSKPRSNILSGGARANATSYATPA